MDLPEGALELFDLPPEEFTAARDRLAGRLKDQQPDAAAAVKALKRPSIVAWALNQVARRHGHLVERLLDADERLRTAASRTAMDEAKADRQKAISAVLAQAAALLGEQDRPVTSQARERLTQTLLSVGADEALRANFKAGTLLKEAQAGAFGLGDPVPVFADEPAAQDEGQAARRVERLRAEAETRRSEASTLRTRAQRARRESDELAQAAANALRRSQQLLDQAGEADREAEAKLAEAQDLE